MAIEDYYTSTVTRKVLSKANSVYGADGVETFSGTSTFLARIWKLKANEVVLDESQKPLVTNRAACGSGNTVLYTDRWLVGSNTYEIISINLNENATTSHHYEVELRLV